MEKKFFDWLRQSSFQSVAGITLPKRMKKLGSGKQGVVYDIGDGKVLKVTDDKNEATSSAQLVNNPIEGVWKVFGVYASRHRKDTYIIIGEKLKPNTKLAKEIIRNLVTVFSDLKEEGIVSSEYFETKSYADMDVIRLIDEYLDEIGSKTVDYSFGLALAMHNLEKAGISWDDLHQGNLLFRGKIPVIIDLGYSSGGKGSPTVFEKINEGAITRPMKELIEFLKTQTDFESIAKVKLPPNPKELGQGSRGIALDIGNNKVLKITSDESEAKAASLLVGKKLRGLYKVYGSYAWRGKRSKLDWLASKSRNWISPETSWFIVTEKLKKDVDRSTEGIMGLSRYLQDQLGINVGSRPTTSDIETIIIDLLSEIVGKDTRDKDILNIAYGLYNLRKLGVSFQDTIPDNMMVNSKNELVLIDIGYSKSSGKPKAFEGVGVF